MVIPASQLRLEIRWWEYHDSAWYITYSRLTNYRRSSFSLKGCNFSMLAWECALVRRKELEFQHSFRQMSYSIISSSQDELQYTWQMDEGESGHLRFYFASKPRARRPMIYELPLEADFGSCLCLAFMIAFHTIFIFVNIGVIRAPHMPMIFATFTLPLPAAALPLPSSDGHAISSKFDLPANDDCLFSY